MKIAYITVKTPFGKGETFIIPEIKEVLRQGHNVIILPFRPDDTIFHKEAEDLRGITNHEGIFSLKVLMSLLIVLLMQPLKCLNIVSKIIFNSRNLKIAAKNISTIPKGFYASRLFRKERVEHIHAHWASTPSTVAYIASYLSGIPWSFTAHRWDIAENNLLKEKVKSAVFARAINEAGKEEIVNLINDSYLSEKVIVIHMGVSIPETELIQRQNSRDFTIICPANLLPIKGHRYLIEACSILSKLRVNFKCLIAGDGPLEGELKLLVNSFKLENYIEFLGRVPHEKLLQLYRDGMVDIVVLPSIVTEDAQKEGIPVALMEAMAYSMPVISTNTGGIPELVKGAGLLVLSEDSGALANAITEIASDKSLYQGLMAKGRKRVEEEFEICKNTAKLNSMIKRQSYENNR